MPLVVNGVSCWGRSKRKSEPRGLIKQSNTHSQPQRQSDCENLSVSVHTQSDDSYVEVCMHHCVDSLSFVVSLALSLARSLSPYHRVSLALSKVCIQCISFLLSPALALSRSPFQPLSRLHLSLFPVFSISLPPFRLHSLSTLSSCPQPRSLDRIRARAYVFTLKSQIIFGDRQLVSTSRSKS